ncbi:DUF6035 family protein [Lacinutrix sp.]|uniref:DUF6035 family protein n=1 Tax=Lacinutrix sp. TaxID=1937692 RepID=UPI0025BA0AE3|nr:DUF6035 family protein [Lacinutrix sp.]
MSLNERSIKSAFDKSSGEILEADKIFQKSNDPFKIRRRYHAKEIELSCLECQQDLAVSDSKYNRLYFKHKHGHSYCILSDGNLTPKEQDVFNRILIAKESERHIELKNKIGTLLKHVDGVDSSAISIDDKFIILGDEKRRPDVYCKYKDKELVFEIQLSDLSLAYILSRYEFYKKHEIYLIWILDDFDIHNQGTLERDIKYLTKYENFFKLDENSDSFKLKCEYKFPFLTNENQLLTKWLNKSVSISQLKFDSSAFQAYFYNFGDNRTNTEKEQKIRNEEIQKLEKLRLEELKLQEAKEKAENIILKIQELRKKKYFSFENVKNRIDELSHFELKILNSKIALKSRQTPIIKWFKSAKNEDIPFLDFLINCRKIDKDINEKTQKNTTVLQTLIENEKIKEYEKIILVKKLLEFDYELDSIDEAKLNRLLSNPDKIFLFETCNKLKNRSLVPLVFDHPEILQIIESAKRQELIVYKYKTKKWVQLANLAIQFYKEYWEYIELAFRYYDTWKLVEEEDSKKSFSRKLHNYYSEMPQQNFEIDELINELYPEIYAGIEYK